MSTDCQALPFAEPATGLVYARAPQERTLGHHTCPNALGGHPDQKLAMILAGEHIGAGGVHSDLAQFEGGWGQMVRTTLGKLSDKELEAHPAWEATGELDDGDQVLVPALLTADGRVASSMGEVWCRSICRFADGEIHSACAMYRGDSELGPLGWTVSSGVGEIPLIVPPAPPPVLVMEGPVVFAQAFMKSIEEVFPLEITSAVEFEMAPCRRSVIIGSEGVLLNM